MMGRMLVLCLWVVAVAMAGNAGAQVVHRADAATATDPVPQSSTSTFGDWSLVCQQNAGAAKGRRCEVSQTILDEKKQPLLHIAVGVDATGRRSLVVLTPVSVRVEMPVVLKLEGTPVVVTAPFRYCLPAGCFAEIDVGDAVLAALRAKPDQKAALEVGTIARTLARVPVSLAGFDPAWAAYGRELQVRP